MSLQSNKPGGPDHAPESGGSSAAGLQQRTQPSIGNDVQRRFNRVHKGSIDSTVDSPFPMSSQPAAHLPYSSQVGIAQSGSLAHKAKQDSLGASFLTMGTDSSPNTSFSSKQATRHQSNGSIGAEFGSSGRASHAMPIHSSSSNSSIQWNGAQRHVDQGMEAPFPSMSSPPRRQTSSPVPAVMEDFSDDNISPAAMNNSSSDRPRPSTRGAKLGMQLAKQRSAAASHSPDQPSGSVTDITNSLLLSGSQGGGRTGKDERADTTIVQDGRKMAMRNATNRLSSNEMASLSAGGVIDHESQDLKPPMAAPLPRPVQTHESLSDITIATLGATPGTDPASLLNSDGQPLSSKNILTIALQKAQSAVLLDSSNNVPEAIMAYRQAVRLLQEVMDRVSPKISSARSGSSSRRQNREEERRRLKVIYETYAERIRLLSMIHAPHDSDEMVDASTAAVGEISTASFEGIGDQTVDTSQSVLAESEIADRLAHVNDDDYVLDDQPVAQGGAEPSLAPAINVQADDGDGLSPTPFSAREELRTPATPYFDIDPMLGLKAAPTEAIEHLERRSDRDTTSPRGQERATAAPTSLGADLRTGERMLVSPTVMAGSILQRRKSSVSTVPTSDTAVETEAMGTPTLASTQSMQSGVQGHGIDQTAATRDMADVEMDGSTSASLGRKRAISQPSQRRPGIPASFMAGRSTEQTAPPLPVNAALTSASSSSAGGQKMRRKASMPLNLMVQGDRPQLSLSTNASRYGVPSPAPSNYSGYHVLGTPMSAMHLTSAPEDERRGLIDSLFPSHLPSTQLGMPPSFASNSAALGLPWIGVNNSLPDTSELPWPPSDKSLRPFHTMRQLQISMERGAFVTRRLYVDREAWLHSGTRLNAIETKARTAEMLSASIENTAAAGAFLLHPDDPSWPQPGTLAIHATGFLRRLDELDAVMGEVQVTLSKKLGHVESVATASVNSSPGTTAQHTVASSSRDQSPAGTFSPLGGGGVSGKDNGGGTLKRSNMNTLNSLSSKLQRSLNQMVAHNSKAHGVETPALYVESLSKLFARAQTIGDHLRAIGATSRAAAPTPPPGARGYPALNEEIRGQIERRLRRTGDFLTNVVLRFVLRDITVLLDKSLKRTAGLLIE